MIFCQAITIPPSTTVNAESEINVKLTHGILHKIEIMFPTGCFGLAGVSMHDALHQILPTSPETYFIGDGETISFREHLPILEAPYTIQIRGINYDDTFNHTITVRLGILPLEILAPWLLPYEQRVLNALQE